MYKIMYKMIKRKKRIKLMTSKICALYLLPIIGRYVNQTCIEYTTKIKQHINFLNGKIGKKEVLNNAFRKLYLLHSGYYYFSNHRCTVWWDYTYNPAYQQSQKARSS